MMGMELALQVFKLELKFNQVAADKSENHKGYSNSSWGDSHYLYKFIK